jgi:hypothetical protein
MSRRIQQFTHNLGDFESIDDERRSVFDVEKTSWYERTKNTRGAEAKDDMDTIQNFMKLINAGFHARGNTSCGLVCSYTLASDMYSLLQLVANSTFTPFLID